MAFNPKVVHRWTPGGPLDRWLMSPPSSEDAIAVQQLPPAHDMLNILHVLERLVAKYSNEPFLLVRLAEVYDALQHQHGAKRLAMRALEIVSNVQDEIFRAWVLLLIEKERRDVEVQARLYAEPSAPSFFYARKLKPLASYTVQEPHEVATLLLTEWNSFTQTMSKEQVVEGYSRLLCIETNELEDVFRLGGKSIVRLVRAGFFMGAIEQVDPNSILKDKANIVAILRDVQKAIYAIRDWSADPKNVLTEELVLEIHSLIVQSNRITSHFNHTTGERFALLVPVGEWRRKTVFAQQIDHETGQNGYIIFHPFEHVPESMRIFSSLARPIFDMIKGKDYRFNFPYTFAAWIHHTIISIHPFVDGNGRMARIVASIPLVMLGLPPICVSQSNNRKYHEALRIADLKSDIGPLAAFLASESISAMRRVIEIGPPEPMDWQYAYDRMGSQFMHQ